MMNEKDKCKDPGCTNLRCAGSSWCHNHGGMDFLPLTAPEPTNLPPMPTSAIQGDSSSVGTTIVDAKWLETMLNEHADNVKLVENLKALNFERSTEAKELTRQLDQAKGLNEELSQRNLELAKRCVVLEDTIVNLEQDEALQEAEDRFSRISVMYTNLLLERF